MRGPRFGGRETDAPGEEGELVAGRYRLDERIGAGGASSVYRAHDEVLGRTVAVKILRSALADDPEFVERFRREAQNAARLAHPNIVTVIDRGEDGGRQYIVLEHVRGRNLKEEVRSRGPLPVREALALGVDVGRALAFAHANGVVHRDVKPQNVILGPSGPKVADFGVARATDALELTMTATVLGTADYMAPEQARGLRADERADVYALGVVLYELLTGSVPYPGDSHVAVAMRHVNDPVPDVRASRPDVPARAAAALERALAKDPDDRFPSMDAFVAELSGCLLDAGGAFGADEQATIVQRPEADTERILPGGGEARTEHVRPRRRPRRRLRLLAGLLALGLAGAGAAAGFLLWKNGGGGGGTDGGGTTTAPADVTLRAVAAYDPSPGDGHERDDLVPLATDGSTATAWQTERYNTDRFGNLKSGVGIVVDAGRAVRLPRLEVSTPTPGFTAEVQAGDAAAGPFETVSGSKQVAAQTAFDLDTGSAHRYYVLWITRLPPSGGRSRAEVSEIAAG